MNLRNTCLALSLAALEAALIAGATSAIDFLYLEDAHHLSLSIAVPLGIRAVMKGPKE